MNSIMVQGHVGQDPRYLTAKNGSEFMTFSVADNQFSNGSQITQWWDVTVFDAITIKRFKNYLKKGSSVTVFGSAVIRQDAGKDGKTYIHNSITADRVEYTQASSGNTETQKTSNVSAGTTSANNGVPADYDIPMNSGPVSTPVKQDESDELPF